MELGNNPERLIFATDTRQETSTAGLWILGGMLFLWLVVANLPIPA
jgi:hypothetical protein